MVFSGFKKSTFFKTDWQFYYFFTKKNICASVIAATSPLTLGEKALICCWSKHTKSADRLTTVGDNLLFWFITYDK